jgi:hypothetical protein
MSLIIDAHSYAQVQQSLVPDAEKSTKKVESLVCLSLRAVASLIYLACTSDGDSTWAASAELLIFSRPPLCV